MTTPTSYLIVILLLRTINCVDVDPRCTQIHRLCPVLATRGECGSNPKWMHLNCGAICLPSCNGKIAKVESTSFTANKPSPNIRPITGSNNCTENDDNCSAWASVGECIRNVVWMLTNCGKYCNPDCKESLLKPSRTTSVPIAVISSDKCTQTDLACFFWEASGECQSNPVWMDLNCGAHCNPNCEKPKTLKPPVRTTLAQLPIRVATDLPTARGACSEINAACSFWAATGECQNNPIWMNENCGAHCNPRCTSAVSRPGAQTTCQSIQEREMHRAVEKLVKHRLVVTRENFNRQMMDSVLIKSRNKENSCLRKLQRYNCNINQCYNLAYRTMDGTCNNLHQSVTGAAFQPFRRMLPAIYDDQNGSAFSSIRRHRPNPRDVTNKALKANEIVVSFRANALTMQWGQFISHDLARTTLLPNTCGCTDSNTCFNVKISPFDKDFSCDKDKCCVRISRSTPTCKQGPREQFNQNTAYLDGSAVYGGSLTEVQGLRSGPFLKSEFRARGEYPPTDNQTNLFIAGDERINLFVGLVAIQTMILREHNRLVRNFQRLNPHWNSDRLFQEARKVVGGEIQAITYNQYLPKILGPKFGSLIGIYNGYNKDISSAISNEFTAAGFRFGHGMVADSYQRLDRNMNPIPDGPLRLEDAIFQPQRIIFEGGAEAILRGMMHQAVKMPQRIITKMTERLFGNADISSINIQRGRDHGLPSYTAFRELCGMKTVKTIKELSSEISDPQLRKNLRHSYVKPEFIDLYTGALLEDPVRGALVGPTIACIIGDQFKRTRDGDRFWYMNPGVFTMNQRSTLNKYTLSRMFCDNGVDIDMANSNAFGLRKPIRCQHIPELNLTAWTNVK